MPEEKTYIGTHICAYMYIHIHNIELRLEVLGQLDKANRLWRRIYVRQLQKLVLNHISDSSPCRVSYSQPLKFVTEIQLIQ